MVGSKNEIDLSECFTMCVMQAHTFICRLSWLSTVSRLVLIFSSSNMPNCRSEHDAKTFCTITGAHTQTVLVMLLCSFGLLCLTKSRNVTVNKDNHVYSVCACAQESPRARHSGRTSLAEHPVHTASHLECSGIIEVYNSRPLPRQHCRLLCVAIQHPDNQRQLF